jgi:hypothetical protein
VLSIKSEAAVENFSNIQYEYPFPRVLEEGKINRIKRNEILMYSMALCIKLLTIPRVTH